MNEHLIYVFALAGCMYLSLGHIAEAQSGESFGRTHFILGLPRDQQAPKSIIPKQEAHSSILPFTDPKERVRHAFFSPDDNIKQVLIDLIATEKRGIKVAAFMLTDKDIAQALIDARLRGITVEVVIDANATKDRFSKIDMLKDAKITIYRYESQTTGLINDIMHHKFILFKDNIHHKSLLWTGSFNLTKTANDKNHENVLIVEEPSLIEQYDKRFDYLKDMISKFKTGKAIEREVAPCKHTACQQKEKSSMRFAHMNPRKRYARGHSASRTIIKNITKLV